MFVKKLALICLSLFVCLTVFCSCTLKAEPTPQTPSTTEEGTKALSSADPQTPMNDDGTGAISLNMTFESCKNQVESFGWSINENAEPCSNPSSKAYSIYPTDGGYGLTCTFDSNNQLKNICVSDSSIQTQKGLRVGDTIGKMKELYGEPSSTWSEGGQSAFRYYQDNNTVLYITAITDTDKIYQWEIGQPSN